MLSPVACHVDSFDVLDSQGSKGKVADFTCNTSTVQKLYDAINNLADSEEVISAGAVVTPITAEIEMMNVNGDRVSKESFSGDDNAVAMTAKLDEMKKMLTEKDGMIKALERKVESSKNRIMDYEGIIEAKDKDLKDLKAEINKQKENHQEDLTKLFAEVDELSRTVEKKNKTIMSLESELHCQQKATRSAIAERTRSVKEWEELKSEYERERRSLRMLSRLAVKRVKAGVHSLLSKLRRKISE